MEKICDVKIEWIRNRITKETSQCRFKSFTYSCQKANELFTCGHNCLPTGSHFLLCADPLDLPVTEWQMCNLRMCHEESSKHPAVKVNPPECVFSSFPWTAEAVMNMHLATGWITCWLFVLPPPPFSWRYTNAHGLFIILLWGFSVVIVWKKQFGGWWVVYYKCCC